MYIHVYTYICQMYIYIHICIYACNYIFHKDRTVSEVSYITCPSSDHPQTRNRDRPGQIPKPELNYPN